MREAEIQREVEAALGGEPDLVLLRNSVGRAKFFNEETGSTYTVPFGLGIGSPDLVGILRTPLGLGVWFCIELKVPGEHPTEEQRKCHAIWRRFGALVYVATSVDEARRALDDARQSVVSRLLAFAQRPAAEREATLAAWKAVAA